MANLQIVSGTEIQTPAAAPRRDAGGLRQAYLQQGNAMARGAEAIGELAFDVSQKFQQNRNARTLLDADLKMRQFSDQYRDSLAKNPNEDEWVPTFKEQSDELKQSIISGPHVGPDVKRQLQANLDRWQGAQQNEITTAAQLQSLNRTKETVIKNYTYALHQGDEAGAFNAIKFGEENHALFPEDAERMRREAPGIVQRSQADLLIETNPQKALQLLKSTEEGKSGAFKNLSPNDRLRLTTQAAWRWHGQQSQNADSIRVDVDSGNIPSDEEIQQKEEAGIISAKGAASIRRYIKQKDWAESRASAAEIMSDASGYDPTQDKDGKLFRDIQDSAVGLPQRYRDRITKTLQARVKNSDKSDDGMRTIDRLYEARTFGDWTKLDANDKRVRDTVGWKKANDTRWDMQEALQTFREQNPQATHSDEREFIMKRAQQHFDHQATQAVIDGFTGGTQ